MDKGSPHCRRSGCLIILAARAYALVAVAVMAAVASMASVGERQSQTVALPLQDAAAGLGMSHQPAALFPEWYLAPWERGVSIEHSGSVPAAQAETLPLPPDFDAIYHPGETIEPTPSPVQAATVRAAAYGGSLTEAEMIAVLYSAGWPEGLHRRALEVSYCESRWSPYAVGDGGRSLGLFQMQWSGAGWRGWFIPAGEDEAQAHDPVVNARTAWWAYQRSGWGPWSCAR